jgi:PncC family amidohydrolase
MFSIAESLTGGLVASKLTDISGISKVFKGGIVAYSLESKINLLQIDEKLVKDSNGVSKEVAEQMAINVAKIFNTEYGIATTGYAEPYNNNVVQAYIAISEKGKIIFLYYFKQSDDKTEAYDALTGELSYTLKPKFDRNGFRKHIMDTIIDELVELSLIEHGVKS